MGKRRNTAKTGDKALYKKAAEVREDAFSSKKSKSNSDDHMYDDVDQYHNQKDKDFMKFDDGQGSESEDEEEVEAVMDLGVGGDSSSESNDDSDSEDDDDGQKGDTPQPKDLGSSDSSDDDEELEMEDVRDWGRRKSAYYHGDTGDLEIGQEEEDAYLEEEAAKEVQAARYEEMDEADFMLSDDEEEEKKNSVKDEENEVKVNKIASLRDVSKLSSRDRRRLIEKQHPGLMQILSHFSESVQNLKDRTSVATKALFDGGDEDVAEAIGATKAGQKYLLTKALIESSTALNLAMFLFLKSEETSNDEFALGDNTSSVQFHPVMKRLQELNVLKQKLKSKVEDKVDGLEDQVDSLMKAAELMASGEPDSEEEKEDHESEGEGGDHAEQAEEELLDPVQNPDVASSSSDDESSIDEEARARSQIQDARFGLRPSEMMEQKMKTKRKRRAVPADVGDDGEAGASSKYLSSAINSIQQRAASRKKKRALASEEELVDQQDADDQVRRGLEMMEAELGKLESDEEGGEELADDMDSDGDDGFYSAAAKKSKRKKAIKKSLYQVAPKYPRLEGEVEGERAINRQIMKNRGLVPHKNKLNRNPRVKKREQYRKALIKRKGAVREVRTDEGHKYGGEETGIKSGISRSRKLGSN